MSERTYWRAQIIMAVALVAIFASPHVIHHFRDPPGSLPIMFTTDDGQYQARIRAALLHRWSEVSNGMIGGTEDASAPKGASPALQETIAGTLFSLFGFHAPIVTILLTIFLTPLIVFLLAAFLRGLGFSRTMSFWGMAAYVFVFLTPLQKPVNMSLSLPFTILTLLLVVCAWRHPVLPRAVAAGVLLGLLPWIYFWSWTWTWAVVGWFVLLHFLVVPVSLKKRLQSRALLIMSAIALLIASVYFIELWTTAHGNPDFAATAARSTIIHSRWVESVPRFILSTLLLVFTSFLFFQRNTLSPATSNQQPATNLFSLAAILGMYTSTYQNFVHGVIFTFSSHYYPFVCLSVLIALLWAVDDLWHRPHSRRYLHLLIIATSSIFLFTGLWDYRDRLHHMLGHYYVRNLQHLAPAVRLLDDGAREAILTDRVSSLTVSAWTDDDAIFTPYVRHVLVSDSEYAERYCLTELFNPSGLDLNWLAHEVVEVPREEDYAARRAQFAATCDPVRKDPERFLKKYRVTKVLWNEWLYPQWTVDTKLIAKIHSGSGWSLWELR